MSNPLPIKPVDRPIDAVVTVPGSKSITNRALLIAALASGVSVIEGALFSDDTRYMAAALKSLGIKVEADETASRYVVEGAGGRIAHTEADLFIGNAGTAARFLTAFITLGNGLYRLDGIPRMRQRPIGDLLDALRELGCDIRSEHEPGCLPIMVHAKGLRGGRTTVASEASSQYLTALLLVAPYATDTVTIEVAGSLSSEPYIDMTLRMMRQWGVEVNQHEALRYTIAGSQTYGCRTYRVEPDASGASYFFAAAAVTGGRVRVEGIGYDSLQGDVAFVDVLEQMGCSVDKGADHIDVMGPARLHGVEVDMNPISDTVMTLAAIAPFADSPTNIHNVAHIRHKESDRIHAVATELRRIGVNVDDRPDGLTIYPCDDIKGVAIDTYDDHRMAMSFAVTGLRAPGIAIREPECINKTFPDFFERLERLR